MNSELEQFSKIFRNDLLNINIRTVTYDYTDRVLFTDLKGNPICNINSRKFTNNYVFYFNTFNNYKTIVKNIITNYIKKNNEDFSYSEVISGFKQINNIFKKNIIKNLRAFKTPIWREFDRPSLGKIEVGSINFTFGNFKIFDSMSFYLDEKYGIVKPAALNIQEIEFYSDKITPSIIGTPEKFSNHVYKDFEFSVLQHLKSLYLKHNGNNNIPTNDELLDFSFSIEMLEY